MSFFQGIKETRKLPSPCNDDPGALTKEQRAERGIDALPRTLDSALEAFEKDTGTPSDCTSL